LKTVTPSSRTPSTRPEVVSTTGDSAGMRATCLSVLEIDLPSAPKSTEQLLRHRCSAAALLLRGTPGCIVSAEPHEIRAHAARAGVRLLSAVPDRLHCAASIVKLKADCASRQVVIDTEDVAIPRAKAPTTPTAPIVRRFLLSAQQISAQGVLIDAAVGAETKAGRFVSSNPTICSGPTSRGRS
jgi:hypothetical protein